MSFKETKEEIKFWNDAEITKYFATKPADPRVKARLEKVNNSADKTILDLGCGGGRHSELVLQLGFSLRSIDVNPQMIEFTRSRIKPYIKDKNLGEIVSYGSIENIPYLDELFDGIVTTGVLHQAKDLEEYKVTINELSRVLKPGGFITLNIFTNRDWDDSYEVVSQEGYTVRTKEGLYMTLLPKELFYFLMENVGLILEEELIEETKMENTGPRTVLRANFIKNNK